MANVGGRIGRFMLGDGTLWLVMLCQPMLCVICVFGTYVFWAYGLMYFENYEIMGCIIVGESPIA